LSVIGDSKVVTFGGCHSEYVHMNEMHIFDMANFLANPSDVSGTVLCTRVNATENVPSTRWGHAAATYGNKLYIVGGRNEQDIIDLHEFDVDVMKWKTIDMTGAPKPRRRHSAVFVSGALVMFGGFDGSFYNDLNICDFSKPSKQVITIEPSTIDADYKSLVNSQESADIVFTLDHPARPQVYGHKALILFRAIEKELMIERSGDHQLKSLMQSSKVPEFLKAIYNTSKGTNIFLRGVSSKQSFVKLLEFLYCDKFVEATTPVNLREVSDICVTLGLTNTSQLVKKMVDYARHKIHSGLLKDLQAKRPGSENIALNRTQQQQLKARVDSLEQTVKVDFSQVEDVSVQSAEDKYERLHSKALSHMNQCKNLDEFHDVVFLVEGSLIKANSLILSARCDYFKSMLSSKYKF